VDVHEPHAPALVPFTDAALTPVFSNSALVVTREIEWGTVVLVRSALFAGALCWRA
jgi:hypothetical protein